MKKDMLGLAVAYPDRAPRQCCRKRRHKAKSQKRTANATLHERPPQILRYVSGNLGRDQGILRHSRPLGARTVAKPASEMGRGVYSPAGRSAHTPPWPAEGRAPHFPPKIA